MSRNKRQPIYTNHQRGFTLIEVMVAVAIVALAVSALLFSVGKQVESSDYLREKILAQWLALNILQEAQLTARATEKFPDEQDNGDSKFANRDWRWEIQTTKTEDKNFSRLDVKIYAADSNADGDPIANASGYLDKFYKLKKISDRNDSLTGDDDDNGITDETESMDETQNTGIDNNSDLLTTDNISNDEVEE